MVPAMQAMVRGVRLAVALGALTALAAPAAAGFADPSLPGPFAVGVATLALTAPKGGPLATEVWYPAAAAGRDVALRRGRFPLVLVAHGNCGFRTNYEYLTTHLAGFGFIVAAPDFPGIDKPACDAGMEGQTPDDPVQDLEFLRTVFHDRAGPAARFAPAVRGRDAGLVGHSLGGFFVLEAALGDSHFRAVVALAPVANGTIGAMFAGLRPPRVVMVMGATADTTVPFTLFTQPLFDALPPPAFLVRISGGTHSGFTDVDSHLPPAALARQQALVERWATAAFARYLRNARGFSRFLTPIDARVQGTDVQLTAKLP